MNTLGGEDSSENSECREATVGSEGRNDCGRVTWTL